MSTTAVTVTIDGAALAELRRLAGDDVDLSRLLDDALVRETRRLGMLALLDELDREQPISAKGRAAGERLWKRMLSSTPERSRQQPKPKRSARRSGKH
ncbi:MAG: hypothetical protein ABR975_00550 [Vulcanimicrobiaceae bacterium]|jgi:hypothetical protein